MLNNIYNPITIFTYFFVLLFGSNISNIDTTINAKHRFLTHELKKLIILLFSYNCITIFLNILIYLNIIPVFDIFTNNVVPIITINVTVTKIASKILKISPISSKSFTILLSAITSLILATNL